MRRDAFDEGAEELAEDIVADIPATPAEIAAELPENMATFLKDNPELPDDVDTLTNELSDELLDGASDDPIEYLSVLLPDHLVEDLD